MTLASLPEFSLFLHREFCGYPNHEELENKCLPDREFSKRITRARSGGELEARTLEKFGWPTNKWRGSRKSNDVYRVACVIDLPSPSSVFIALQAFFCSVEPTPHGFVNFLANLKRSHA